MTTEVKETDAPTRSELRALVERLEKEAARYRAKENTHYASDRAYWQGSRESTEDAVRWLQELLDNHLPIGGNFDDMPF